MKEWTTIPTVGETEEGKKNDETGTGGGTVPNSTRSTRSCLNRKKRGVGFGGVGVPKVKKRPTTTPCSPLLGSRRRKQGRETTTVQSTLIRERKTTSVVSGTTTRSIITTKQRRAATQSSHTRNTAGTTQTTRASTKRFTARPIPSSAHRRYQAGPMGVPKVSKRAGTVPVSPCLGLKKRSARSTTRTLEKQAENKKRRTTDNNNHATY